MSMVAPSSSLVAAVGSSYFLCAIKPMIMINNFMNHKIVKWYILIISPSVLLRREASPNKMSLLSYRVIYAVIYGVIYYYRR